MKKTTLILALVAISTLAWSQIQATLTVEGSAMVAVTPTTTTVNLTIESSNAEYVGALNDLTKRIDLLTKELKKAKFEESQILTSNFNVHNSRIRVNDIWKDSGFVATQTVVVTFPHKKERLIEVLNSVTNSGARPTINLSFGLDDERKGKVKNELMKLAVKDSKSKAELLAGAADHKVVGIKEIRYGQTNSSPGPLYERMETMAFNKMADVQISNFEVSELTFSDGVTVVYLIDKL
ncbi:MAG: SIMPL domain-containing protein [Marinoscillum sp.]